MRRVLAVGQEARKVVEIRYGLPHGPLMTVHPTQFSDAIPNRSQCDKLFLCQLALCSGYGILFASIGIGDDDIVGRPVPVQF